MKEPIFIFSKALIKKKDDEHILICFDKSEITKGLESIKKIIIFGNIQCTAQAIQMFSEHSIPVSYYTVKGKYLGTLRSYRFYSIKNYKILLDTDKRKQILSKLERKEFELANPPLDIEYINSIHFFGTLLLKEDISDFIYDLGIDDVGFIRMEMVNELLEIFSEIINKIIFELLCNRQITESCFIRDNHNKLFLNNRGKHIFVDKYRHVIGNYMKKVKKKLNKEIRIVLGENVVA